MMGINGKCVLYEREFPMDEMLNTLLRGCVIAMQLSLREGFEVKVTEALMKGKPVVAYRTGGIPSCEGHEWLTMRKKVY